jgi:hypothetical protein
MSSVANLVHQGNSPYINTQHAGQGQLDVSNHSAPLCFIRDESKGHGYIPGSKEKHASCLAPCIPCWKHLSGKRADQLESECPSILVKKDRMITSNLTPDTNLLQW